MESARCKAFLAAVETGSFSKAAEVLNYTPSGVSQLVTSLENDLGFPLLRRNPKGVTLTENGKQILPAVRDFLLQENRIFQLAAEISGLLIGSITIASYSSISTHWLP
nr:LysR family transcriptional regulator [Sporomusaceae bacterium]